ncbi:MAG: energy transducer TonB [Boseongicola sp.]|nr:MAG: energy transducer TonB [Boseongicola sp.]
MHVALLLALLFGGLFMRDRVAEVAVAEVSVISEAEYAALTPPTTAPELESEAPSAVAPPEDNAPEAPSEDAAPELPEPEEIEEPDAPDAADLEVPQPVPDAVVVDDAPVIEVPDTDVDGTSLERDQVAAPAPRVAPTPSIAPPPDAEVAPERIEDTAPAPEADPVEEVEPEEPAAPEEASDRIVTEAEEVKELAPASSMRPRARPARPVRQAEAPVEPKTDSTADAAAVAEANETPVRSAPSGPPLTGGEKDALRVAVSQCWNVGSLSTDALGTTVVVSVEMQQSGKPINESIKMVSSSGGSSGGARQAFEAARRAIIRCGVRGFSLPVEKYDHWRDIELTFNPEGMQFR